MAGSPRRDGRPRWRRNSRRHDRDLKPPAGGAIFCKCRDQPASAPAWTTPTPRSSARSCRRRSTETASTISQTSPLPTIFIEISPAFRLRRRCSFATPDGLSRVLETAIISPTSTATCQKDLIVGSPSAIARPLTISSRGIHRWPLPAARQRDGSHDVSVGSVGWLGTRRGDGTFKAISLRFARRTVADALNSDGHRHRVAQADLSARRTAAFRESQCLADNTSAPATACR